MAEVVDSIIVELIARTDQYKREITAATEAYRKLRAEMEAPISDGGPASAAAKVKKAAQDTVQAEEQATAKVTRTRKARSDAEVAEAERAKIVERERVAVIKQAVRDEAAAVKAAEKEKQAAIAETRTLQERAAARPGNPRRVIYGPVVPAAAAGTPLARPTPAPASVSNYSPEAAVAATSADTAGAAAAKEKALAEAEANDRMVTQLGLKAQIIAADDADKVALQDQLNTLRQFESYRRRGLSDAEAQTKVEAELLDLEAKRARVAAEQVVLVEKQMRAQSGAIANKISGAGVLTGALVGGLGAAEISHLNDRYIELSNSLKVAGVSAFDFDAVQQHLLTTANKNGTNINTLADVFRSASLGAHDLGASQADLLKLTDAASNALRIQGVSASKAQGSLLQLGHAFESGRVNAREFNSLALNLYPILQAAAKGSDQFGGSVAKLRAEIIAGNVSSRAFFDAIISGSSDLEARAGKATLTTAQGFTSLTNALVVYFGEADKAQGVSAALGEALKKLGDNLDVLIPAIAAVGTALTVGYITRMALAASATEGLGAAILGAFGGPIGLAITAVTLGIGALVIESNSAVAASKAHAAQSDVTAKAIANLNNILNQDPSAGVANNARALANARLSQANATYQAAAAEIALRRAQASARLKDLEDGTVTDTTTNNRGVKTQTQTTYSNRALAIQRGQARNELDAANRDQAALDGALADAKKNIATAPFAARGGNLSPKAEAAITKLTAKIDGLEKIAAQQSGKQRESTEAKITKANEQLGYLKQGIDPSAASAGSSGGAGRRGPSADTLAKRAEAARLKGVHDVESYNTQLKTAHDKELQAQADLSDDVAARAVLERQRVLDAAAEQAKNIRLKGPKDPKLNAGVAGTGDLTAEQTTNLLGINTRTADLDVRKIDKAEDQRKASDALSIDTANIDLQKETLQAQQGLADTLAERRKIAQQLLDLEYQEKDEALQATLAKDSKATPAEREVADAQRKALPGQKALAQQGIDQSNQGVGRTYADSFGDRQQILEGGEVKVLQDFNSGLDQTVTKALHLHGIFGQIVDDLVEMAIKQALIAPLANTLFPASSGSGGAGGIGGGIFGSIAHGIGSVLGLHTNISNLSLSNTGIAGLNGLPSADDLSGIAGLPGFATGGSGVIGGNSGVDRNLLSLNGQPVARVGKGEMLSISPNGMSANTRASVPSGGTTVLQTIAVDAKGAVMNDQFASQILSKAAQYSNAIGHASYQSAVKDAGGQVSGIVQRKQTLGS